MDEKRYQIVLNGADARSLLRMGHEIVDIREKRESPRESLFVFLNTESFRKDFEKMIKK